jgi:hypothetical protein
MKARNSKGQTHGLALSTQASIYRHYLRSNMFGTMEVLYPKGDFSVRKPALAYIAAEEHTYVKHTCDRNTGTNTLATCQCPQIAGKNPRIPPSIQ